MRTITRWFLEIWLYLTISFIIFKCLRIWPPWSMCISSSGLVGEVGASSCGRSLFLNPCIFLILSWVMHSGHWTIIYLSWATSGFTYIHLNCEILSVLATGLGYAMKVWFSHFLWFGLFIPSLRQNLSIDFLCDGRTAREETIPCSVWVTDQIVMMVFSHQ